MLRYLARRRHTSPLPVSLTLTGGETFYGYVSRGTVLHFASGTATLAEAPHWLAETTYRATCQQHAGDVYCVSRSGWMTISALSATQFTCREPGPAESSHWRGWRIIRRFIVPSAARYQP